MFFTPAFAQGTGGQASVASGLGTLIFPLIIFFIFYMLVFRPQQQKMKQDRAMRDALRRGDQVVTAGGVVGKVFKVQDDGMVEVEIADGVKVKIVKHAITQVLNKTEPAAS
jgi:preprotein translocase subunit YajC